MQEGVLLAHALVARIAEQVGARVLFIKGPTAVALGVRPNRPSTDVDVLVDPAAFEAVICALRSCGWEARFDAPTFPHVTDLSFEHSEHLLHPDWPCDIDAHYNFPGFLASPDEVFEALWERRTTVAVAGRDVPTPDDLGQALVVALHALRDPGKASSAADMAHVRATVEALTSTRTDELLDLATATGCRQTAAPVLPRVVGGQQEEARTAGLSEWQFRQQYGEVPVTMWLVELKAAPWRHRPAVLRQALFPTMSELERQGFRRSDGRSAAARLWAQRWWRAVRVLPTAVRGFNRATTLRRPRDP